MQHNTVHLTVCGILLVMTACTPQPTATILPPTATPLPPTATSLPLTPTSTAIPPAVITEIDNMLATMADKNLLNASVLIGQRGIVLLNKGYGLADREQKTPITPQTRFRIGDITQQFTAMAILVLETQDKLSVEDPICNYLTECPTTWQSITIHQLLAHTSGIPDFSAMSDYNSRRATPSAPTQTIERFKDLPLDFQPGEKWGWSNSNYLLLGVIIEQVSGQSYEAFLQQSIFTPLNMRDSGYAHDLSGLAVGYKDQYTTLPADYIDMSIPYAAGGLYSTAGDIYTWVNALNMAQLIPQASQDKMFASYASIPNNQWEFGYGWAIGNQLHRTINFLYGGGEGFLDIVMLYVDDQVVIIVLGNQEDKDPGLIENIIAKKLFGVP